MENNNKITYSFLNMKSFPLIILSIGVLFYQCSSPQSSASEETQEVADSNPDKDKEEWISLFNGKDLNDWTPNFADQEVGVNYKNTFKVEDSLLTVRYDTYTGFKEDFKFGHLFYKDKFSYYRLRATYRFVGKQVKDGPAWAFRNNGLMLHCQSPESMELDQGFPTSLELQLLGGNGEEERTTGNLCTPGTLVYLADTLCTDHCINSNSKTFHGDQWVNVEALVYGDSLIHHVIEGDIVFTLTKPSLESADDPTQLGEPLGEGYISIQAETHPIDFAKIELLNLCGCMDEQAKNYKSYYIKEDNSQCIY